MRSEVQTNSKKPAYPGLYRGDHTGVILLMTRESTGTVVGYDNADPNDPVVRHNPIGTYSCNWSSCNMRPFDGQVTLKSE